MQDAEAAVPDREAFTNEPVDADDLPRLDDSEFEDVDPAYVRLRTILASTVAAVIAAVAVVVAVSASSWVPVVLGAVAVALVGVVGVLQRVETAHMGYLVREHDLSFRSGVISRSVATVPFARVQHVSIGRGPADRRFGIATLQLRTAGGQIALPGLAHERAERLKQLVADRAGELADAEVDDA